MTLALLKSTKTSWLHHASLLSIIRSLNTVFTATGICYTSYIDCLLTKSVQDPDLTSLADSQHNSCNKYHLPWIQYWDSWWWTVSLSETCRVLYQNKVQKYCILLAFFYKNISRCTVLWMSNHSNMLQNIFAEPFSFREILCQVQYHTS